MPAHSIRITGRVQGVLFRDRTKAKAEELGLTGWVRNRDDGSVEIHAEGSDDALKELEQWCWKGPPAAIVESVRSEDGEVERCEEFEIIW